MTTTSDRSAVMAALETGVEAIMDTDAFRAYLDAQARMHTYSLNNVLLILHQRPDAAHVAGYRAWQALGRQVRKGEKGIRIMVPFRRTVEDDRGEKVRGIGGFGVGTVFDVAQTDGDDLPTPPSVAGLTGETDTAQRLTASLVDWLAGQGIPVTFPDILPRGAHGTWDPTGRTVTVLAGMPADQTAKTMAHEAAHAIANHDRHHIEREDAEAVAECAAYLVCAHHGIDTGAHTFGYVAGWARDRGRFRRNLGAARDTAHVVLDGLTAPATTATPGDALAA